MLWETMRKCSNRQRVSVKKSHRQQGQETDVSMGSGGRGERGSEGMGSLPLQGETWVVHEVLQPPFQDESSHCSEQQQCCCNS